jgi:hypothetical protein
MNVYTNPQTPNTNTLPQGFWQSAGGAYTQSPTTDQFTSNRLNDLISGGSRYIQNARDNASASAAARGLGNSSYAAGNAELAAINAALPIAQQDAQTSSQAALANQQALNQILQANNANRTSVNVANIGAGASRYGADRSYQASRYAQDQQTERQRQQNEYDAGQSDIGRQFQQGMLGLQDYYTQQRDERQQQYGRENFGNQLWGNILSGAYSSMFSNPDYFGNPDAALGFINGFGNFANNQIGQFLYGGSRP